MNPDADSVSWLRVAFAFLLVFGLIAGMTFVLKYVTARGFRLPTSNPSTRRLRMVESLPLDIRRRLVIVRCDGAEHLLLLGPERDIVVTTNLPPAPESPTPP